MWFHLIGFINYSKNGYMLNVNCHYFFQMDLLFPTLIIGKSAIGFLFSKHITFLIIYTVTVFTLYSKTCLKQSLKNRQNKGFKDRCVIIQVKSIAFCNTFNLH